MNTHYVSYNKSLAWGICDNLMAIIQTQPSESTESGRVKDSVESEEHTFKNKFGIHIDYPEWIKNIISQENIFNFLVKKVSHQDASCQ